MGTLDPYLKEDDFFSSKNPERQRRREERAGLIRASMVDTKDVSKLEGLLQDCRVGICSLLTEVRAIVTAKERIASGYFPGLKILFKSYVSALNELDELAGLLADHHNALADYIKGAAIIIFDAGFAGRIKKVDNNATDQAAEERVGALRGTLVAFAKAEMVSFFDQCNRAAEILKPMVRGEATPESRA